MTFVVVDTDVLIASLRGKKAALEWLESTLDGRRLCISAATVTELTGGMRAHEKSDVYALIRAFDIEAVTAAIAYRAGEFKREYRRSHNGIDLGDYLVAATADILGGEPATLNIKHYPMFPGLNAPFKV